MSVIVHSTGKGGQSTGLAGALRWAVLATSEKALRDKNKIIRTQAGLIGAQSYVTLQVGTNTYLGQYTQAVTKTKKIRSLHSLGLAFLAALMKSGDDQVTINAILLVEPDQMPEKRALVIIEGGVIVRDVIEGASEAISNAMKAREALSSHVVYAQHSEIPGAQTVTWGQLLDGCSKNSLVISIPKSPALYAGVALVLIGIGAYFAYQKMVVEPEKRRKAQAAAIAADQTPVYLAQLNASLSALGWERKNLNLSLTGLATFPMYHAGWVLEKRECFSTTQTCDTNWTRRGGKLSALQQLLGEASYDVAGSSMDTAIMRHKLPMVAGQLELEQLIDIETAAKELREVLQGFANADISVSTTSSEKWPAMNYTGVRPSVIASRGAIEITVPLPKISDVLAVLPNSVVMDSYTLMVSQSDIGSLFKVTLKGYVYAK